MKHYKFVEIGLKLRTSGEILKLKPCCSSVLVLLCLVLLSQPLLANDRKLNQIHSKILRQYPNVQHIAAVNTPPASESVLYFDVREKEEFAVSHLDRAIQVSPDISAADFREEFSEQVRGKTLIFYCSVGRRASKLIDRLQPILGDLGLTSVANLEGGVFRWHNDQRVLFQGQIETNKVHPYSWLMSRLLVHRELSSYHP